MMAVESNVIKNIPRRIRIAVVIGYQKHLLI